MTQLPAVQARGLSKVFSGPSGERVTAVHEVDLELYAGEVTLIMGPSGSGKTTLLSLIAGILSPTAGSIHVSGQALAALHGDQLQAFRLRQLGFVFQNSRLVDGLSAAENVELPLDMAGVGRPRSQEQALRILEAMGLSDRADFGTSALSGGEKQRVSVARALVTDPAVLLADEPTAMLDAASGDGVIEGMVRASDEGAAVLIVSHDPRLAEFADRTLHLEEGRIKGD